MYFFQQLREEEQAAELASVTESSPDFSTLDFAISGLIMQNLASSGNITNNLEVCLLTILQQVIILFSNIQFQEKFTRSFSNLLNTDRQSIRESQITFQTASNILDTLNVFGRRLSIANTSSINAVVVLEENNFQLQVEDIDSDEADTGHDFLPNLTNSLPDIQANALDMPLQGATLSLPSDLLNHLGLIEGIESLRILNILLQTDVFFVTENTTVVEDEEDLTVGNLIITASVFGDDKFLTERQSVVVANLSESQSVRIRFNLTEVCVQSLSH